jgi:hypothetical protein
MKSSGTKGQKGMSAPRRSKKRSTYKLVFNYPKKQAETRTRREVEGIFTLYIYRFVSFSIKNNGLSAKKWVLRKLLHFATLFLGMSQMSWTSRSGETMSKNLGNHRYSFVTLCQKPLKILTI